MTHEEKLAAIKEVTVKVCSETEMGQTPCISISKEQAKDLGIDESFYKGEFIKDEIQIIQKIGIAELLRTMNDKYSLSYFISMVGNIFTVDADFREGIKLTKALAFWDLKNDSLDEQSKECISFLFDLLV